MGYVIQTFLPAEFYWGNIEYIFSFYIYSWHSNGTRYSILRPRSLRDQRGEVNTMFSMAFHGIRATSDYGFVWSHNKNTTNSWWRHQMETFSALLALYAGNSPVLEEYPAQRPVTRSFDISCDLRLNKRLSKQSWGWWFETLPRPLWRHSNVRTNWRSSLKRYFTQGPTSLT